MTHPDTPPSENPDKLPEQQKSRRFATFAFAAMLICLGFGVKTAWALCTNWWTANGISLTAPRTTNETWYYNNCKIQSGSNFINANTIAWSGTGPVSYYLSNWQCNDGIQTRTYTEANCSWYTYTIPLPPSSCTLSASPSGAVTAGTSVTLTAACSGGLAATSYSWTNTGFSSSNASGTVTPTTTTTYSVTPSNTAGNGNTASVTVDVVPAVPTCTLTPSPATINLGDSSTLTSSCSPTPTSYAWTNTGFATNASGGNVTPSATTAYSVTGSNTTGAGTAASATVTVRSLAEITGSTAVSASALSLNRATGKYSGTIRVKNNGGDVAGPLYVFFTLPQGVTLATLPTLSGVPYVIIQGGLAAGATSGSVTLTFTNPTNARITYTTKRFVPAI